MRALQACCGHPWLITPPALSQILEIANRENDPVQLVEARMGRRLDNSHTVTTRDGVATIPVEGPIFRRADFFTEVSGATSIETLATDLRTALDDPTVQSIILAIDSPGGSANGVAEFADMIYQARSDKPITAYVSGQGCSAAYWIAAATSEIVTGTTAMLGSIGVVMAVPDPSKTRSRDIEFVSSQSPHKRPDPTTKKGSDRLQASVDRLADLFVEAVATYRDVTPEKVLADFGQGDVLFGQDAVDAGLADRVGTYEGVLASAQAAARAPRTTRRLAASAGASTGRQEMSWRDIFRAAKAEGIELGADAPDPDAAPSTPPQTVSNQGMDPQMAARLEAAERENAELKARMAAEQQATVQKAKADREQRAEAFVEATVRAGLALPAERDTLQTQALRALEYDAATTFAAGEPTNMALLETSITARTAHPLTKELLSTQLREQGMAAVASGAGTEGLAAADQAEKLAREYAARQNRAEAGNSSAGGK